MWMLIYVRGTIVLSSWSAQLLLRLSSWSSLSKWKIFIIYILSRRRITQWWASPCSVTMIILISTCLAASWHQRRRAFLCQQLLFEALFLSASVSRDDRHNWKRYREGNIRWEICILLEWRINLFVMGSSDWMLYTILLTCLLDGTSL